MPSFRIPLAGALAILLWAAVPASALTVIEPGNRHTEQPPIPGASKNRTKALKTTFDRKYKKVLGLLQRDKRLIAQIKKSADDFGIDPIHMIGAIVGEHTYNVDAYDRAQTYYVKAVAYLKGRIDFEYDGEMAADVALNADLMRQYPFCRLSGPANVLVMPAFHSASISTRMLQELGGSTVIGPLLVGLNKPVQIVSLGAKDADIVNMAALAAYNANA